MHESSEQQMRTLKLGGLAKAWRTVEFESPEQYVRDLLTLEARERDTNRINRMVKMAGFMFSRCWTILFGTNPLSCQTVSPENT